MGSGGYSLQEGRLSHTRRADNGDELRGRFIGESVDEGHMEALLSDLRTRRQYPQPEPLEVCSLHRVISRPVSQACPGSQRQKLLGFALVSCQQMGAQEWTREPIRLTARVLLLLLLRLFGSPVGLVLLNVHLCASSSSAVEDSGSKKPVASRSRPECQCRAPEIFGRQIFGRAKI